MYIYTIASSIHILENDPFPFTYLIVACPVLLVMEQYLQLLSSSQDLRWSIVPINLYLEMLQNRTRDEIHYFSQ